MGIKIAATYANGVFAPDGEVDWAEGDKVWVECHSRFEASLPADSPLAATERELILAFANGGWDEARVREGSRLAWEAVRQHRAGGAGARMGASNARRPQARYMALGQHRRKREA